MKATFITLSLLFLSSNLLAQFDPSIAENEKIEFKNNGHINLQNNQANSINDNLEDFHVNHYKLEIVANPYVSNFSGTTTITFTPNTDLSTLVLDAGNNLTISNVVYHGSSITNYTHSNEKISIVLPNSVNANATDSIKVSYSGNAADADGYNISSHNGTPVLYTLSESFQARRWWICKNFLDDKADAADIYITHPANTTAGSNGILINETISGNDKITHWKTNYPIATYLMGIAVTNYVAHNSSVDIDGVNVPIVNYLYPERTNFEDLENTGNYISFYSQKFGAYPFKNEKYGHAEWNWGGGMEHQTMSFMVGFDQNLIAHELMHQWTGDKVTCGTWSDIWLNEGHATYGAALVEENFVGDDDFLNWKYIASYYIKLAPDGSVYNPLPNDEDRIFDFRLTYQKGAMTAHWLRYKLGDDLYFQFMQSYLNDPQFAYGFATTQQFKQKLETFTNQDFTEFFNDWVYGEGYPIFNLNVQAPLNTGPVTLTVNQTSSHPSVAFFETPFDVTFYGSNNQEITKKFELTENNQTFTITDIPFKVTDYQFNGQYNIVADIQSATLNNQEIKLPENYKLTVYPNPTTDNFTIETKQKIDKVYVIDASGKIVFQTKNTNNNSLKISSKNWPSGVYFVYAEADGKGYSQKILVK